MPRCSYIENGRQCTGVALHADSMNATPHTFDDPASVASAGRPVPQDDPLNDAEQEELDLLLEAMFLPGFSVRERKIISATAKFAYEAGRRAAVGSPLPPPDKGEYIERAAAIRIAEQIPARTHSSLTARDLMAALPVYGGSRLPPQEETDLTQQRLREYDEVGNVPIVAAQANGRRTLAQCVELAIEKAARQAVLVGGSTRTDLVPQPTSDDTVRLLPVTRRQDAPEVCVCAAIEMPDGAVFRGHRHDDCIRTAGKQRRSNDLEVARYTRGDIASARQGFMTTRNRFVSREEAARLMRAAEWHNPETGLFFVGDMLFSEDLY